MAMYLFGPASRFSDWRPRSGGIGVWDGVLRSGGPTLAGGGVTPVFGAVEVIRGAPTSRRIPESSTRVAERLPADLSALDGSGAKVGAPREAGTGNTIPDFLLSACRLASRLTCSSSSGTFG